jgi:ABC-2 type transport system ATP-binding protein
MTETRGAEAVRVDGLVKTYRRTTAVDGISLSIRAGETFGILGTNGAGKTTTVEMIAGLRTPTEGTVRLHGLDPFRDRERVRQFLGVQLQGAALHNALTVRELVTLFSSFYPHPLPVAEALEMVDLTAKAGTRFENLSGGQMQRVSVALALVGRPQVVILDELTTGLDPRARRRMWGMVGSLREQTVILVSHAMDEVEKLCDRVALLDAGRVVAEGTPAELSARAGTDSLEDAFVALTGREPGLDDEYDGDDYTADTQRGAAR